MTAATASPTTAPSTTADHPRAVPVAVVARPGWLADEYAQYEDAADADVCLHLPHEECDHRVYRCQLCCGHDPAV